MTVRVLAVASELYPLVKTGGLADVAGALPGALAQHDVEVTTLIPAYRGIAGQVTGRRTIHHYPDLLGSEARIVRARLGETRLLLLDAPALFDRDGGPYSDAGGHDWPDNWRRFAALARAGADLAAGRIAGVRADILHAHDWQAGLAPAYLRFDGDAGVRSAMTIHNLAFQGAFPAPVFASLGLPEAAWGVEGVEYYGGVGLLKAGLWAADAITTVSPTYAQEILTPAFGMGLEGLLRARSGDLTGIVNGIDPDEWNPERDLHLAATYSAARPARRARNKAEIETIFGLDPAPGPIFCVISRLTWQKGMDALPGVLDDLVAKGGRLALLGSGDRAIEEALRAASVRHAGRIGVRIGYDEPLAHLLEAGADAIVIPSRFEPCGLTQLYGLRYGCVPVVARTGGLADTVIDANAAALAAGCATGFHFDGPDAMLGGLERAIRTYADPAAWTRLRANGMRADYSWSRSAAAYAALYERLLARAG